MFVTKAHRKTCFACSTTPVQRRLVVTLGTGRSRTQRVYCIGCGIKFAGRRMDEFERMTQYLLGTNIDIRRSPMTTLDPCYHEPDPAAPKREKKAKPVRSLPKHLQMFRSAKT